MPSTKDLADNPYPSILVIGDGGTHKTHFTGSCPRPFIFDFDKNLTVLRGKDVDYESFRDLPYGRKNDNHDRGLYKWGESYPRFLDRVNEMGVEIDKGNLQHFTFGLDSLTSLSQMVMNYVQKSKGQVEGGRVKTPSIDDYGQQISLLRTVMMQLTEWPVMLVVTAHIHRDTNDHMQSVEYLPLVTGKFASEIAIYFGEVWYTKVTGKGDKRKFVLQTESDGMFKQAKSPLGVPDGTETEWSAVEEYLYPNGVPQLVEAA